MFSGAHLILYSKDTEADRTFLRDVLEFPHVDAGEGWLISGAGDHEFLLVPVPICPSTSGPQGVQGGPGR
jgi:hypothetical protein